MNAGNAILRLGTRKSALALAQSGQVADALMARHAGLKVELVHIVTTGDVKQDTSFDSVGSVGMFVREVEAAVLDGRVDFAVHSLKDLPTDDTPGLVIHAVPERVTPFDVVITRDGQILDELEDGARVGTGSPRRRAQLLAYRDDLRLLEMRGNVDTRLRKLESNVCDAIILAAAGIERLGLTDRVAEILPPDVMLPAVGQGCLALQGRAGDERTHGFLAALDHPESHRAARAERAFLAALGGGCHAPIAALARVRGGDLVMEGMVGTPDGEIILREEGVGKPSGPERLGEALAVRLIQRGADGILREFGTDPASRSPRPKKE